MKSINGIIEFAGNEYEYRAKLSTSYRDSYPDRIVDLDCADGTPLPADIDFESLEEMALENARLRDWCDCNRWIEEDTGGGCSAFARKCSKGWLRITRHDDPSCPRTFSDPIAIGRYDADDKLIGECKIFNGGIDQYLKER